MYYMTEISDVSPKLTRSQEKKNSFISFFNFAENIYLEVLSNILKSCPVLKDLDSYHT